jgi:rRNA maturation protein Nop10
MLPSNLSRFTLKETCYACPEQYDVYDENNNMVAYFRLRHGTFRVDCPDCGGETVYIGFPNGDGRFDCDERGKYLMEALLEVEKWLNRREN